MDFAECIYVRCPNCQSVPVPRIPSDVELILEYDSGRIGPRV